MFFKIRALKNFASFTGKIPVLETLWKKVGLSDLQMGSTSLRTANSWSPAALTMANKFENAFTHQKLVPIELLNISNFPAFLHFLLDIWRNPVEIYFSLAVSLLLVLFELFSLYVVFLSFTKKIAYHSCHSRNVIPIWLARLNRT